MLPVQPNKDEIKNLPVSSSGCKQEYKTNPGVKNPNNKVHTVRRKIIYWIDSSNVECKATHFRFLAGRKPRL